MLAPSELARWRALPPERRESARLRAWVAKEAWFKTQPAGAAPWDFRRIVAASVEEGRANVRIWSAGAVHVGVCCADSRALSASHCAGFEGDVESTSWRVAPP